MSLTNAAAALKKYFGYDQFRPLQAEIIQSIYDKKDVVVLMPTGGGKSICFQVPAITLDGVAVVVSPLIALMKDQVQGLSNNGIEAAFINSSLDLNQIRRVEDALLSGHIKLLYVSPEKLVSQGFQPLLKRLKISLFAIDEAHCISAWGHDFRPEYTQLKFLKIQFPNVPFIALTATADKLTRKDMVEQLQLRNPAVYLASFDRPNINLKVLPGQRRIEQIIDFLKQNQRKSGIIYCLSRKSCQDISEKLNAKDFKTAYYHAELTPKQRSDVQEDFINDRVPIICATIAFGMGIDKSNVRFVIHYNLPRNLEGYYQEVGRAGRDGLPSEAILFFSYSDVNAYRDMIEQGESSAEQKDLKIAKLNRMYQFAEAPVCRRKTILAYFDEVYDRNCGNCDVCLNPPHQFDGTVAAQKALSAIVRSGEKIAMLLLIDVLRGSQRREIFDQKLNEIKTYGAGKEYSYDDWLYLLSQMLHHGLIEIAYDHHHQLKVTEEGKKVLFEGKKVPLALPQPKESPAAPKGKALPIPKAVPTAQLLREELFDLLVNTRRLAAQQAGVPPHNIFSDLTLKEIAERRPLTDVDFSEITGVGERKLQVYGDQFISEIRRFALEKIEQGIRIIGSSPFQTFDMYQRKISVEEIAETRGISVLTVLGHLAQMYEKGELIDILKWVSAEEMDMIQGALSLFEEPFQMNLIFEHFNERFDYDKIRWSIADYRKKQYKR